MITDILDVQKKFTKYGWEKVVRDNEVATQKKFQSIPII